MNIIKVLAISTVAFAAISCQSKMDADPSYDKDMATATITVLAPSQIGTKTSVADDQAAVGDGLAADNLVLAVFDAKGNELASQRQGDWVNGIGAEGEIIFSNDTQPQVQVTLKLVRGHVYSIVCWAQNKAASCYDFKDMKAISVDYSVYNTSNNDLRDAFYAYTQTVKVTEDFTQTITLERPFAQINVGTADFDAAEAAGVEIDDLYSAMTIKNVPSVLETFTGTVNTPVDVTFASAHALSPDFNLVIDENKVVNDPKVAIAAEYGWLGMNYILVGKSDEAENFEVSVEVREGENDVITEFDVPNVPVKRNHRTNIVGELLTSGGTIDIVIDPIFTDEILHQ